MPKFYCDLIRGEGLPWLSKKDLKMDESQDSQCHLPLEALANQDPSLLLKSAVTDSRVKHREWNRLQLRDGLLYRQGPSGDSEER